MKPLIKWTGGKSREIKYIINDIPNFEKYFEPFFGGGALFFYLKPEKAIINDKCGELMLFYRFLIDNNSDELKQELSNYVFYWEKIKVYAEIFSESLLSIYRRYRDNEIKRDEFELEVKNIFENNITHFNEIFSESFCISQKNLLDQIEKNVIAKLNRIKYRVDIGNKLSNNSLKANLETAFKSGFYIHFRNIMNQGKKGNIKISDTKKIANYYFIREFCYGSMFRYNLKGDFNIPYGGMNYNNKDFRKKVEMLFSENTRTILKNAEIESRDFENIFERKPPSKNDFVFLDPPYDTEFSEYEENSFDKNDQKRLARCILNLQSKFILIIKETPYIISLYDKEEYRKKGVNIESFEKKYTCNVKGRNNRDTKYLIIHNLDNPKFSIKK